MSEKTLKARLLMKNDTATNWAKATNFIPKTGEIIVYNENPPKIKIGDGKTKVNSLPFISSSIYVGDTKPTENYDLWINTSAGNVSVVYTQTEKDKLAGIEGGANNYTLPVASSTLGGVKTTTTAELDALTAQGYAPIPIVDGIPYFMPVSTSENSGFPFLTVGNLDLNLPIAMSVGSEIQPVYFLDGYPYETTYTLEASVPADAKFTDTTYTAGNSGIAITAQKIYNKGILSLAQGTTNGTIKYTFFNQQVNNIVEGDLKIKGLDTAAYHSESYFVPAIRTINNKSLNANISLTASDVGAAASSHTHDYLPLGGGTLTGGLTVNSGGITSKNDINIVANAQPGFMLKNANGNYLAGLRTKSTDGGYNDAELRVYTDTSTYQSFAFGVSSGAFTAPGTITGNYLVSRANSYPALRLEGVNSNATLASLTVDTSNGSYGDLRVDVYSSESASIGYEFRKDGTFWCNALEMDTALSVANGGTGACTRAEAVKNLTVPDGVITNADNHLDIGFYTTVEQTTNLPHSTWGVLSTYKPSQELVIQTWTSTDKAKGDLYMRKNINGEGFSNWFQVMTEDNTISISHGGTGATTASGALANLAQVSANPRSCYITYASLEEAGIVAAASTTEEVGLAMADNTSVMFVHNTDNTIKLTDAPFNYGYIQLGRGYNQRYIYGWAYGTDGRVWSFSRHDSYAGKWRLVYNEKSVIYSSSEPSSPYVGAIWLKPVS